MWGREYQWEPPGGRNVTVRVDIEDRPAGRVARIVVANPAKLNIVGRATMEALIAAFAALAGDAALRAVVLAGEGSRAFIGGADIGEMAALDIGKARDFIMALHGVCQAIRDLPVPVVARMQGYTLGAGLEIAAACDLRIAEVGARMGMPEVRIGIPSVIEAALLPMLIGWGRTRRLLMTGEMIGAETAEAWGLVEEVAPAGGLDGAVERVLADLLAGGPHAMRQQKALIRDWEGLTPNAAIARGVAVFAESWGTQEPTERMAAFLASRRVR